MNFDAFQLQGFPPNQTLWVIKYGGVMDFLGVTNFVFPMLLTGYAFMGYDKFDCKHES